MPDSVIPAVRKRSGRNTLLAVAFAMLIIGYIAGAYLDGAKSYQRGLNDGMTSARQALADKFEKAGFSASETPIQEISGTVVSISGNVIEVEAPQYITNPLADPAPTVRRVTVPEGVAVTARRQFSAQEMQEAFAKHRREQIDFDLAVSSGASPASIPVPPKLYEERTTTLADITPGMTVIVMANENILRAESITATGVALIEAAPAPDAPSPVAPPATIEGARQ